MRSTITTFAVACSLAAVFASTSAPALSFGNKDEVSIKVEKGSTFKGQSTLAIGAFRVAFVTEDSAISTSHGAFSNGGSAAKMTGVLTGVDHSLMQKIADAIYDDFLKQAAAKGYTIIDSAKVAAASPAYSAVTQTPNFAENRLGTVVIPTGQRSVPLAADDSAKESHGSATFGSAFGNLGKATAKSDANKAFPLAAKDVGAPVMGVTIVVNFANFKGTSSSFGSSKATVQPGATIDGGNKNDGAVFTSILAWDAKSCEYVGCMARIILEGELHSDAPLGDVTKTKSSSWLSSAKGTATIEADPALYEKNVLLEAAQATEMLLTAITKEK
jgi:hypothetical protein